MTEQEIHLELLLGSRVFDKDGVFVGRIEEIRAVRRDDHWYVQEYLTGYAAMLRRLSFRKLGLGILNLLGARKSHFGRRVPWDQLDISNPEKPTLKCRLRDLAPCEH